MIVRQLLEMCNKDKLVKEYISMLSINSDEIEEEEHEFCEFLFKLMQIEPHINNNMVLLFSDYIDDGVNYVEVTLYKISEIKKKFRFCTEYDRYEDIIKLSDTDIVKLKTSHYNLSGYSFELTRWKDVLGYNIDEENVYEYGIEKAASVILYEITYFGYDQRKILNRINIIDSADKNLDEFKNKDDYESVHCMTMNDIIAQLEIKDIRTTIEIENDNRKTNYEHICNFINAYRVIKRYYIKNFCEYESHNKTISV